MSKGLRIALAGATGVYGEALLAVLGARDLDIGELQLIASEGSLGRDVEFRGSEQGLVALPSFDWGQSDVALFALPRELAASHAERAAEAGVVVIDASAAFAGDASVPVVGVGFNDEVLDDYGERRIVRTPASVAMTLARALAPLAAGPGLDAVRVAGYLAVAGAGRAGIDELAAQCTHLLNGRPVPTAGPAFASRIAFNCLPTVGLEGDDGRTEVEAWVEADLLTLLALPALRVRYLAAYVPAFYGDGFVVEVVTRAAIAPDELQALLAGAPGLNVPDGPAPTPAISAAGTDLVGIGRLARGSTPVRDHAFWVAADTLRQAATNSVSLVEVLARDHF